MPAIDFPSTLPGPNQVTTNPKVRARNAGLPGSHTATAPERDYYGTLDVSFFLTRAQATTFKTWWDSNQGYWFNAVWPRLSQSLSVYRILGSPTFNHVYDGAYRVSAKVELRGSSLAVGVREKDPHFANVILLVHGDGSTGASFFPDSSSFHHTPTVVGAPTTQPDAGAFRGSSISYASGAANYVQYSMSNFLDTDTQAFTIEFFVDLTGAADISNSIYLKLIRPDTTNALEFGLVFNAAFTARELTTFQASAPNVFTRQHMAFCRPSGGGGAWFINGINYTPGPGGVNYNFSTVQIGNLRSTSPMITGLISEVRITRGVVRYPGTASFTPPTASFPDS